MGMPAPSWIRAAKWQPALRRVLPTDEVSREVEMRTFLILLGVCVFAAVMVVGQSSSDQSQQQPSAQQQQQSPLQQGQGSSTSSEPQQRGNASASGSVSSSQSNQPSRTNAQQPTRAATRGGVPWIWIVIGGIVLVAIFSAGGKSGSRPPNTEPTH